MQSLKNRKRFLLLFIVAMTSACAHTPQKRREPTPTERKAYEEGLRSLSRNDNEGAQRHFAQFVSNYPNSTLLTGALYNEGLAQEALGNDKDAATQYRKIVDLTEDANTKDGVEGLYRLSVCYEKLGDDPKMILALQELLQKGRFLPEKTYSIEIPARLAAAYARQNNSDEAEKYFKIAEVALRRLRRSNVDDDVLIWLPKTLYSIGHTAEIGKDVTLTEFLTYLKSLRKNQHWLLQGASLGNNPWSRKAAYDIEDIYGALWGAISNFKVADGTDQLQSLMEKQRSQKTMAQALDEEISKLKLERLPSTPEEPEPGLLTLTFAKINEIEKKVNGVLTAPDVRDQNTAEALKREGLKREKGSSN